MDKKFVRDKILAERRKLSDKAVAEASSSIYARVTELPEIDKAKTVMVYADFDHEVRTGEIAGWLLFKGKRVALPMVEDTEMLAIDYHGTLMQVNRFGIEEPMFSEKDVIDPKNIDVIICPGVAFTKDLDRVGFGNGFYDKFCAKAPQAFLIGLAYGFQVVDDVETSETDIRMNAVVTPDNVIR